MENNTIKTLAVELLDKTKDVSSNIIEKIGEKEVNFVVNSSKNLNKPITALMSGNNSSKQIGEGLLALKAKVMEMTPNEAKLQPKWWEKLLLISGQKKMLNYLSQYQESSTVIEDIVKGLINGKQSLLDDNIVYSYDISQYKSNIENIDQQLAILNEASILLQERIATEQDPQKKEFYESEVTFRLLERIADLGQSKAMLQQGIMTLELLIKNNNVLCRTVERTQSVTVLALQIGVTAAIGLQSQKNVLDLTESMKDTTEQLILANANNLQQQGALINKAAGNTMISIKKIEEALKITVNAIEESEQAQKNAIPQMRAAVESFAKVSAEASLKLEKIEKGKNFSFENQNLIQ